MSVNKSTMMLNFIFRLFLFQKSLFKINWSYKSSVMGRTKVFCLLANAKRPDITQATKQAMRESLLEADLPFAKKYIAMI